MTKSMFYLSYFSLSSSSLINIFTCPSSSFTDTAGILPSLPHFSICSLLHPGSSTCLLYDLIFLLFTLLVFGFLSGRGLFQIGIREGSALGFLFSTFLGLSGEGSVFDLEIALLLEFAVLGRGVFFFLVGPGLNGHPFNAAFFNYQANFVLSLMGDLVTFTFPSTTVSVTS